MDCLVVKLLTPRGGRGEMKQRLHRRVSKLLSACELQMFVVLNLRGVLCRARVIAG